MSRRAWVVVAVLSWLGTLVLAFCTGAWYEANLPPLPLVGQPGPLPGTL